MSKAALGTDGRIHYADDFTDTYHADDFSNTYSGKYFCPNPNCRAIMILKNFVADGNDSLRSRAYFSATAFGPHVKDCEHQSSTALRSNLTSDGFSSDEFFESMMKPRQWPPERSEQAQEDGNKHSENRLTTLFRLYRYCLQHDDEHVLPDGKKVSEIYKETRNFAAEKRSPHRIVKLRFMNSYYCNYVDSGGYERIICCLPQTENMKLLPQYFALLFTSDNWSLCEYLYKISKPLKTRTDEVSIVVGGEWVSKNQCVIQSRRQIIITSS